MKVLFVYNRNSGHQKLIKKISSIKKKLSRYFPSLEVVASLNEEHFKSLCFKACEEKYDLFIFAGGDGTFNMVINEIAKHKYRPKLALLPAGTINDASKNFGFNKNINRSIKIIGKQKYKEIDICSANDKYFAYVAAAGLFADIPIDTKQIKKKYFGFLAYYSKAVIELFDKDYVEGQITLDNGRIICFKAPFVMFLNSKRVGGFKINPKADISDGKIDFFITNNEPFKGLLSYLFLNPNVERYEISSARISFSKPQRWDIDGEKGPYGDVEVKVLPKFITICVK